jgi:hypothetical protein
MLESNLKILPLACTLSSCVWVTNFSDWWGSIFLIIWVQIFQIFSD